MTTVVDFPDPRRLRDEAAQWLIRLDSDGALTSQELQALGEWLRRSPAHREELENLAALWGRLNVLTQLAVPIGRQRRSLFGWRPRAPGVAALPRGSPWLRPAFLSIVLMVAGAAGWALFAPGPESGPAIARNGLHSTAIGQQTSARLADGSTVALNTSSEIRVDFSAGFRNVYLLQGEAHFTVARDVARPFRVYAGGGRIQAVGTAFAVRLHGEDVEVTVAEGRVTLASVSPMVPHQAMAVAVPPGPGKGANGLRSEAGGDLTAPGDAPSLGLLEAGEVGWLRAPSTSQDSPSAPTLLQVSVEPIPPRELARRLAWREGVLLFSGDTLESVVGEISRYTTVVIEIPDASIRRMRIGGRFPVGETEAMLAALETNFNLRVNRLGPDRVVLTANAQ